MQEGKRRCDAVCHRSKMPAQSKSGKLKCTCICGGKFHGLGSTAAEALWQTCWKEGTLPRLTQGKLDFKKGA